MGQKKSIVVKNIYGRSQNRVMSKGKKILLGVIIGLIIIGFIVYHVVKSALSTITVGIDNKSVHIDTGELLNSASLSGSFNLVITNPTIFPLPPFTLFLEASYPDGTEIGALDTPGRFSVAPSGYTAIPVTFSADVINTAVSGIVNLIQGKGHLSIVVSGYILIWGLFKVPINQTIQAT